MAVKSEPIDLKLCCRCCLKSDADFYRLDAYIVDDINDKKISLLKCLIQTISQDDIAELPKYICHGCSKALHLAHKFMQTALEAHKILSRRLCPQRHKLAATAATTTAAAATTANAEAATANYKQRGKAAAANNHKNGYGGGGDVDDVKLKKQTRATVDTLQLPAKPYRFQCKVCGEKMQMRETLKEHIRLHLDIVSYSCQMCNFDTNRRQNIITHYITVHRTQPTRLQLQPNNIIKTKANNNSLTKSKQIATTMTGVTPTCTTEDLELLIPPSITTKENLHGEQLKKQRTKNNLRNATTIKSSQSTKQEQLANDAITTEEVVTELPTDIDINTLGLSSDALNVASEFIVMPDGSLEQKIENGVIIQYINAAAAPELHNNNEILNNNDFDMDQMDIDDIIVEEIESIEQNNQELNNINSNENTTTSPKDTTSDHLNFSVVGKQQKCSVCGKLFVSSNRLKAHMLTHRNLPKYYCDMCSFVTLLSSDLMVHYRNAHKSEAPVTKLMSKPSIENGGDTYSCDMCLFETRARNNLKVHYRNKHKVSATEVQLRPSLFNADTTNITKSTSVSSLKPLQDYPSGLTCAMCPSVFYFRNKYKDHLKEHILAATTATATTTTQDNSTTNRNLFNKQSVLKATSTENNYTLTTTTATAAANNISTGTTATTLSSNTMDIDVVTNETSSSLQQNITANDAATITAAVATATTVTNATAIPNATDVMVNGTIDTITTAANLDCSDDAFSANINLENMLNVSDLINVTPNTTVTEPLSSVALDATAAGVPMICNMDFIDSTDVAAVCTISADDIQVVEGVDDVVIDNNLINNNVDFDPEAYFEDLLESDDIEEDNDDDGEKEEDDDEDDEDDENDDENDNNDITIDQNQLLLTSDDDDLDDFDDEESKFLQKPFCMHCNKKFTSQYHFENHMFLHRGLAPYRCQMCTNLYNTKRALLRHYRAVHKLMPSRDMVQAKGDKVSVDRTPVETINVDEQKSPPFLCAKCPYECGDKDEMLLHLKCQHYSIDSDKFIISKLPFECSRCIRSFVTKKSLVRHLQRSHLVATIIEQSAAATTSTETTKTTNSTPTTTNTELTPIASTRHHMMPPPSVSRCGDYVAPTTAGAAATGAKLKNCSSNSKCTRRSDFCCDNENCIMRKVAVNDDANICLETMSTSLATLLDFDYNFIDATNNNENGTDTAAAINNNTFASTAVVEASSTTPEKLHKDNAAVNQKINILSPEKINQSRMDFDHQCGICFGTYRTLTLLKKHVKRHLSRNYACEFDNCDKTFVTRTEYEQHKRVHDESLQFVCMATGCNKKFSYKHHLKRHQDIVHRNRRYCCPLLECGRQLTTKTQFKRHIQMHKGSMCPYKCLICDKRYTRRVDLRNHSLRVHSLQLDEYQLAEIYRNNTGCTNRCDMKNYQLNDEQLEALWLEASSSTDTKEEPPTKMLHITVKSERDVHQSVDELQNHGSDYSETDKAVVNIL